MQRSIVALALSLAVLAVAPLGAQSVDTQPTLLEEQERRIAVVRRVVQPTIAVIEPAGGNGGSGVIVSEDGYAVTNFHVVLPCGPRMVVGLSDGRSVDAVLVGLDPTGDIALIKLLGEGPYPAATWGDSDSVRVGDEAIVVGNPFLLAEDFSPSVSIGVISGVRRYQFPSDTILEYADCLQTDAAINPGNSGGPLFDGQGRLIGINGRGSFEKRGRVNVGVGYAVSSNQVRRFMPRLRCGLIVDHASLGATVRTMTSGAGTRAVVDAINTHSDAYRRGLRAGDELLWFGTREISTANDLLNVVGATPDGVRLPLRYRRGGAEQEVLVRTEPLHSPGELREASEAVFASEDGEEEAPDTTAAWRKWFEHVPGFANHYFTRLETDRVLNKILSARRARRETLPWFAELVAAGDGWRSELRVDQRGSEWVTPKGRYRIDALSSLSEQRSPPAAPGLLAGMWAWRVLVTEGPEGLDSVTCFGATPWTPDGESLDLLRVEHAGARADFYVSRGGEVIGFEVFLSRAEDPTRVELDGFVDGEVQRVRVVVGDTEYAVLDIDSSVSEGAKEATQ